MSVDGTKFQVNYKLADGTLINLYAKDVKDLETGLTDLAMVSTLIKSTGAEFTGGAAAPTVESVAQAFNATPVAAAAPAAAPAGANTCRHGVMAYREGVSARGPWKGYMCAAPKGATDKCDTIWVR